MILNEICALISLRPMVVGPDDIAAVVSMWSGIQVLQITADERRLLFGLDKQLRRQVVGQDEAVAAISRALKRFRVGLKDPERPMAVMLFCGPTGVGKTQLTKALAGCYFGSVRHLAHTKMCACTLTHTCKILLWPTEVGETELTKALAACYFGPVRHLDIQSHACAHTYSYPVHEIIYTKEIPSKSLSLGDRYL